MTDNLASTHEPTAVMPYAIDAAHLARQRAWSEATFGPGDRTKGVIDHIRKELAEIEADPTDLSEWVDVLILAFDGAWRAGWEPQQIIDAIEAKQTRNEQREWPDWRTQATDRAIEHTPASYTDAISKVLRDAPPEGMSAVDIRQPWCPDRQWGEKALRIGIETKTARGVVVDGVPYSWEAISSGEHAGIRFDRIGPMHHARSEAHDAP